MQRATPDVSPAPPLTASDLDALLAQPGTRVSGRVDLADGMLEPICAPIELIVGQQPGPRLYLGGGLHGNEYNTIEIAWRVLGRIDPAALRGSVIGIPVQNPPGFAGRMRGIQTELWVADLNRAFPGAADGSLDARVAASLFTIASRASVVIDLHTASANFAYVPLGYVPANQPDPTAAVALTAACGAQVIYQQAAGGSLVEATSRRGALSTIIEMGAGALLDAEFIDAGVAGVLNGLHHLGMLPGEPTPPRAFISDADFTTIRAPRSGFLHLNAACELGADVVEGQPLADLRTYPDGVTTAICAPHAGTIIQRPTWSTVVQAGDRLIRIAQRSPTG